MFVLFARLTCLNVYCLLPWLCVCLHFIFVFFSEFKRKVIELKIICSVMMGFRFVLRGDFVFIAEMDSVLAEL